MNLKFHLWLFNELHLSVGKMNLSSATDGSKHVGSQVSGRCLSGDKRIKQRLILGFS